MNAWWWVPIGLAAWCLVAVVMALCIGAVLRRASQARESLDRQVTENSRGDDPLHVEAEFDEPAVQHADLTVRVYVIGESAG